MLNIENVLRTKLHGYRYGKQMTYKSEIGTIGEDLACEFLINKNYEIVWRNFRRPWGEIDIIAKDPANTLVFVEVKTMRQNNPAIAELHPEDNLTAAKLKKLKRTAQMFVGQFPEKVNEDRGWRIDLLAITISGNKSAATHYENI